MYAYIKGKISNINSTYIVIDNNGIGYQIFTPNPYSFNPDKEYIIYLHQHVREDELSLYGFKTLDEKELFLKLIEVKGLGAKMTLPMLATGSVNGIIDAIERENIIYLKKFPRIGDKIARQIILDLKGKIASKSEKTKEEDNDELIEALKGLGYKSKEINKVIPKIDTNEVIENQIKKALKLFLN
ncbi:MAG: Holliday junction branch migration protein RuvA [bacterium]